MFAPGLDWEIEVGAIRTHLAAVGIPAMNFSYPKSQGNATRYSNYSEFLNRQWKMRLLMYLAFTAFLLPFWGLNDLWRAGSDGSDLLINGIAYLVLSVILPWALVGFPLLYLYLLLFFLAVGHTGGWRFIGLFAAVLCAKF